MPVLSTQAIIRVDVESGTGDEWLIRGITRRNHLVLLEPHQLQKEHLMNKIIKWFKGLFKTPGQKMEEDRKRLEYQSQFLGGV